MFVILLQAMHAAHGLILREGGALTTLTVCVVAPLCRQGDVKTRQGAKYVACVVNVGDSLAYVFSPTHGVREITQGTTNVQILTS